MMTGGSAFNTSFVFDSGPTPQKIAVFVDLSYTLAYLLLDGFGIGLGVEGRINDFSTWLVSGNFGMYSYDWGTYLYKYSAFDFGVEANYRYYIFKSAIDKLFINAGVGFGMKTWNYEYGQYYLGGQRPKESHKWSALYIPVYAGYKIIIGPGFVVEVQAGYRVGINIGKPKNYIFQSSPSFGGAIYGIALGWAF